MAKSREETIIDVYNRFHGSLEGVLDGVQAKIVEPQRAVERILELLAGLEKDLKTAKGG